MIEKAINSMRAPRNLQLSISADRSRVWREDGEIEGPRKRCTHSQTAECPSFFVGFLDILHGNHGPNHKSTSHLVRVTCGSPGMGAMDRPRMGRVVHMFLIDGCLFLIDVV